MSRDNRLAYLLQNSIVSIHMLRLNYILTEIMARTIAYVYGVNLLMPQVSLDVRVTRQALRLIVSQTGATNTT